MSFSPQRRAILRHRNRQKWSKHAVFCTFWLSKCAFRHSGVQFFDIETDKSGPNMRCFVHFDFQMCFSPQRRAIFRHLNRQKCSEAVMFCTFWLSNVLFATAACNFSTSEQTKVLQGRHVLYIFTSKCAFRHSGVQFLMSPLSTYLRTRRFNRPTFGLTRHTNLWNNTAFRDFSNIFRGCIFFLLTFWLLHLLSTDLTTLLLLFNSPYCRKFLFKLPSITFLVGNPYKPLFATVTGKGPYPNNTDDCNHELKYASKSRGGSLDPCSPQKKLKKRTQLQIASLPFAPANQVTNKNKMECCRF